MTLIRWPIWISALIGAIVFFMPWLLANESTTLAAPLSSGAEWNLWIAGVAAAAISLAALVDYRRWEEWLSVLIGVWLIASPWVFGFTAASMMAWSVGIAGGLLVVLGAWSLMANIEERRYA
jgi:hypothetical protein